MARASGEPAIRPEGLGFLILRRAVGFSQRPAGPMRDGKVRWSSESLWLRSSLGFGAFALLDGPGLTQFQGIRIFMFKGFRVLGL